MLNLLDLGKVFGWLAESVRLEKHVSWCLRWLAVSVRLKKSVWYDLLNLLYYKESGLSKKITSQDCTKLKIKIKIWRSLQCFLTQMYTDQSENVLSKLNWVSSSNLKAATMQSSWSSCLWSRTVTTSKCESSLEDQHYYWSNCRIIWWTKKSSIRLAYT